MNNTTIEDLVLNQSINTFTTIEDINRPLGDFINIFDINTISEDIIINDISDFSDLNSISYNVYPAEIKKKNFSK